MALIYYRECEKLSIKHAKTDTVRLDPRIKQQILGDLGFYYNHLVHEFESSVKWDWKVRSNRLQFHVTKNTLAAHLAVNVLWVYKLIPDESIPW